MRVSCTALAKAAGPVSAKPPTTMPTIHGAAKMPRATSTATSTEKPEDRARDPVGVLAPALAEEPRVDRDEGGREYALAEEVLEDVRDPERGGEGAGERRGAQVVGEDTLADQPHQPRGEDPQRHQRGAPARLLAGAVASVTGRGCS